MPLLLRLHPSAHVEIDPILAEQANGRVEAAEGARIVLGRPKNLGPRSHLDASGNLWRWRAERDSVGGR
ncbi:hypothetical protein GXW77_19185 [Roseomonas alkaliterrae]|uniref:Uncharacterized protein n=1 Tax=Neoroseomonas alkaliterrae TaxID=1452450 RepID=A0A840XXI3_9PROT|nr:hypothetical protein [Neoroseomonas alkaliterrae]MBB5691930.1 hypothetical protein [Neoroseomonas alkaliterrae]MBR0678299.1 hypothetical protein [Neoroseomonas alkaliterrae]